MQPLHKGLPDPKIKSVGSVGSKGSRGSRGSKGVIKMPADNNGDRPVKTPQPRQIGGSLLLWLAFLISLNLLLVAQPAQNQVPYSKFISQVEDGQVAKVEIGSERITYELKSQQPQQDYPRFCASIRWNLQLHPPVAVAGSPFSCGYFHP